MSVTPAVPGQVSLDQPRRVMAVACGAHALHDGFTDLLYVLLPIWQAQFGLTYGEVGFLRALYSGTMAGLQVPAGSLAGRIGGPLVLTLGTALAGLGFLVAGASGGVLALGAGLALSGLGSSTQHPIASDLVARAYAGPRSRAMLGTYNFAGDVGKVIVPATLAVVLTWASWHAACFALAAVGGLAALAIRGGIGPIALPRTRSHDQARENAQSRSGRGFGRGFHLLLAIGAIDSATRMPFLTFLPFVLQGKGADLPTVGLALSLVFAGGAGGKLVCGFLGQRLGVFRTVLLTEGATALGIVALLVLPLLPALGLLPLIGLVLNGTSSVLYGSVPELVEPEGQARAFGLFYTGTIGSGALAPVAYGLFSDRLGITAMMILIAGVVLLTLPLAALLRSRLPR